MADDRLAQIERAFAVPRPEHFTDFRHCEECAEHDDTLRSHTPTTIGLEQLGNPGWDSICFITDAGFQYYMPGLVRLSLDPDRQYMHQFLFHLGARLDRIEAFNAAQRAALLALLTSFRDDILAQVGNGAEWEDVQSEWLYGALESVIARCQARANGGISPC